MKKLICALLSVFLISPCMAEIHIDPDAVTSAIAMHFPEKQVETLAEYNAQLRTSNGAGIAASKIWNVCAAGGLNIKQNTDKDKCRSFVEEVANSGTSDFFAVCGKGKNTPGGKCVQDFRNLTVNTQQAEGLAKLYASINSDAVQCNGKVRNKTTVLPGPVVRMVPTYLQCSSNIDDNFYEFQFNNMDGNADKTNHNNFKKGICKLFNSNFTTKDLYGHKWDICSDITDEKTCEQMDSFVRAANIGYIATWGPAWYTLGDRGYEVTSDSLPYCVLSETIINGNDGTVLIEHTAFGLDGRVFLAGIQRKGSQEIKAQIRSYVENTMGKENVKSFSCENNYHTVKLKGRSGNDDLLQCTVNGELVDFFFDDLSEAWGVYDKSGREAMTCATWGGTFTGKRCIGLEDEKTCNTIRDANKELCPECKLITWNEKTKTCNLPLSVTANALRKGLNYTAIVGGATVSVVITVGTLGTATVPTAVVLTGLAVETLGAGVELVAQAKIDSKADDFFVKVNNCNNQTCAEQLIKEYLQVLSNQQNDLSDAEISAADKTFAILFDKIPNDAQFWQDIKAQGMQGQTLEDNKGEFFDITSWNSEQIWRAVGISLQVIPTLVSIGWRVAKHSDRFVSATAKLRSKLQATTKTDNVARTTMLNGLDPNFTHGTSLDPENLQVALEITADELYAGRFLEGNANISQGMITDVTTAVNKHYAQERNILFFDPTSEGYIDDIIRQADKVNTDKVITGVVDMTDPSGKTYLERAIQTIEEGGVKDAVIPIGAPGHQMTLIKQGDEWTVLDQYAYAEPAFKETKDAVIGIVGKNAGSKEKVVTNIGQVCDNTTGSCALFSQGMGRIVLEETDGIKIADEVRYLNKSKQQMNQSIVDDIVDQMDRDVGLRVLDMLE